MYVNSAFMQIADLLGSDQSLTLRDVQVKLEFLPVKNSQHFGDFRLEAFGVDLPRIDGVFQQQSGARELAVLLRSAHKTDVDVATKRLFARLGLFRRDFIEAVSGNLRTGK